MTGPVTINTRTPGYGAFMATLLKAQPVQTGAPGTGHSSDLIPFDARVRAAIAQQSAADRAATKGRA